MAASTRNSELEAIDSPRLQQVLDHFRNSRAPARVVAVAAIFTANKVLSDAIENALAPLKLSKARFEILGLLDNTPGGKLSLRTLTKTTLHHPATMTYTIDSLEKAKLVKRRPDPSDRRGVLAEITAAGRERVREGEKLLEAIDWGLGALGEPAATQIAQLLAPLHPDAG